MDDFPKGTKSAFARAVAAEVRAMMAAQRVSGRELFKAAGFRSNNYLAIRLRDEAPFTLDDIDAICRHFGEGRDVFVKRAYDNHIERLRVESADEWRATQRALSAPADTTGATQDDMALAASEMEDFTDRYEEPDTP